MFAGLAGVLALFAFDGAGVADQLRAHMGFASSADSKTGAAGRRPDGSFVICGKIVDVNAVNHWKALDTDMGRLIDGQPPRQKEIAMPVGTVIRTPLETCLINTANAEIARMNDAAQKMRAAALASVQTDLIPPDQLAKMEASMTMANEDMRNNYLTLPHRNLTVQEIEDFVEAVAVMKTVLGELPI